MFLWGLMLKALNSSEHDSPIKRHTHINGLVGVFLGKGGLDGNQIESRFTMEIPGELTPATQVPAMVLTT